MGLRASTIVWANSQHKSTELLVLLAIADFADDDGMAFPGLTTLAKKARTTRRNLQRVLDKLVASGELVIDHKNGIKTSKGQRTNRYIIQLDQLKRGVVHDTFSVKKEVSSSTPPVEKEVTPRTSQEVASTSPLKPKEVSPVTPKPSVKDKPPAIEPSEAAAAGAADNIFQLYENAFGKPAGSPLLIDELKDIQEEFALDWIADALRETVLGGGQTIKYTRAILVRWQKEGRPKPETTTSESASDWVTKLKNSKYADFYTGLYSPEVNDDHSAGLDGHPADAGTDATERDAVVPAKPGPGAEDRGGTLQGDSALHERAGRSAPLLPSGHARGGLEADRAAQ